MIKCWTVVLTSELFWLGCCTSTPQVLFFRTIIWVLGSVDFFGKISEFNVADRSGWVYSLGCRNARNRLPINVLTYYRRAIGSYWPPDHYHSFEGSLLLLLCYFFAQNLVMNVFWDVVFFFSSFGLSSPFDIFQSSLSVWPCNFTATD